MSDPWSFEGVERSPKGGDAALRLTECVLLVAPPVGLGDDLGLGQLAVVGDVGEASEVAVDGRLTALSLDEPALATLLDGNDISRVLRPHPLVASEDAEASGLGIDKLGEA